MRFFLLHWTCLGWPRMPHYILLLTTLRQNKYSKKRRCLNDLISYACKNNLHKFNLQNNNSNNCWIHHCHAICTVIFMVQTVIEEEKLRGTVHTRGGFIFHRADNHYRAATGCAWNMNWNRTIQHPACLLHAFPESQVIRRRCIYGPMLVGSTHRESDIHPACLPDHILINLQNKHGTVWLVDLQKTGHSVCP